MFALSAPFYGSAVSQANTPPAPAVGQTIVTGALATAKCPAGGLCHSVGHHRRPGVAAAGGGPRGGQDQCSPHTARPGTSMHEKGLAIDFTNCGKGSPCFTWLSRNAGTFGLKNYPPEPWHWSTTGS